jgi:hypothetical protein
MTTTNGTNNGTARNNPRLVLADWIDKRVKLVGFFEKILPARDPGKTYRIALIQDAEVELPTKARHDLGHIYVQKGETFKNCSPGSRVAFTCRVRPYRHRNGELAGELDYGFDFPNDIRVVPGPIFVPTATNGSTNGTPPPAPAPPPPPTPPGDPLAIMLQIRDRLQALGGVTQVLALLDAVAAVGGWDKALEARALVEGVGGIDKFKLLLDLIKV